MNLSNENVNQIIINLRQQSKFMEICLPLTSKHVRLEERNKCVEIGAVAASSVGKERNTGDCRAIYFYVTFLWLCASWIAYAACQVWPTLDAVLMRMPCCRLYTELILLKFELWLVLEKEVLYESCSAGDNIWKMELLNGYEICSYFRFNGMKICISVEK